MKKLNIIAALLPFLAIGCLTGCGTDNSVDRAQQAAQERSLQEANRQVGMPNISNFTELKWAKHIYEERDNPKLITYVYLADMQGGVHYVGRAIGFGLPYSTQFSNPEKQTYYSDGSRGPTLPQAEPNGLYMPATAEGTWVDLLDDQGNEHISYFEPRVIITTTPLK